MTPASANVVELLAAAAREEQLNGDSRNGS